MCIKVARFHRPRLGATLRRLLISRNRRWRDPRPRDDILRRARLLARRRY